MFKSSNFISQLLILQLTKPKLTYNTIKYEFSTLKSRLLELKSKQIRNHQQLYEQLSAFEASLQYNQWLKFKQHIHEMDRKYRLFQKEKVLNNNQSCQLLYKLDSSITSQYFYQKHTQSTYYSQPLAQHKLQTKPKIKSLSLQKLQSLTQQYLQHDLQSMLTIFYRQSHSYDSYLQRIDRRFQAVEESLCRHIYKGYDQFSNFQENLFFKTQQKYKGDFKFQIIDQSTLKDQQREYTRDHLLQIFAKIARNLVALNQCRPKIQLAVEMMLTHHWQELKPKVLCDLLFCTAASAKDLKVITTNFEQISKRILNQVQAKQLLGLLFYMCISGCQTIQVYGHLQRMFNKTLVSSNLYQLTVQKALVPYLVQSKQQNYNFCQQMLQMLSSPSIYIQSQCSKDFVRFLQQRNYPHQIVNDKWNIIAPYQMILIQKKKFICYDRLFFQNGNHNLSGIAKVVADYFQSSNQKIKVINDLIIRKMDKWTQKQQYFKSKMKGITKRNVVKEKRFDFYSPRQEFFQQKQKQSQAKKQAQSQTK